MYLPKYFKVKCLSNYRQCRLLTVSTGLSVTLFLVSEWPARVQRLTFFSLALDSGRSSSTMRGRVRFFPEAGRIGTDPPPPPSLIGQQLLYSATYLLPVVVGCRLIELFTMPKGTVSSEVPIFSLYTDCILSFRKLLQSANSGEHETFLGLLRKQFGRFQ